MSIRRCHDSAVREVLIFTAIEKLFNDVLEKIEYGVYKKQFE